MAKLVDLTHPIENLMPVYPGDDETILSQTRKLDIDKYNNHMLQTGMHSGTHIDGPMHLTESDQFISQVPLDRFIGEGCIIDARNQSLIEYREEYEEKIADNSIVLLYTAHDRNFGRDEYFVNYPTVSEELAKLFVRKQIKILGLDTPSPDRYPFNIHKLLMNNDILIIENLSNLNQLLGVEKFEIIAFPLKIRADSSILRVIARAFE